MFELSVALKYLLPRKRQLSVSLIALISMLVISLVVWLIVVFFSVTSGLEKNWISRLIALTAPVRVTPTEAYYDSYYYKIDSISSDSDYSHKSLGEKREALAADPYDPDMDMEVPRHWPRPHRNKDGSLKDLVGEAFAAVDTIQTPGIQAQDYEITTANVRITLLRERQDSPLYEPDGYISHISQSSYVSSFNGNNPQLAGALLPVKADDINNSLRLLAISDENVRNDNPRGAGFVNRQQFSQRAHAFFQQVQVKTLCAPSAGWLMPPQIIPKEGTVSACFVEEQDRIHQIVIPTDKKHIDTVRKDLEMRGYPCHTAELEFTPEGLVLHGKGRAARIANDTPLILAGKSTMQASIVPDSIDRSPAAAYLEFDISLSLQNVPVKGRVSFEGLEVDTMDIAREFKEPPKEAPLWLYKQGEEAVLPFHDGSGDGVLLAKHFIDSGVQVGDRGFLAYYTPTASSYQEQRIPIYVAGFYDPGILPIGGKFIMVTRDITSVIRAANAQHGDLQGNGINVWLNDLDDAQQVKAQLVAELQRRGIDRYWHVETYQEYEFTRAIIQQIRSDKNLWSLISLIIILVACSNIVTMLILLVNDKKVEIGILRAMGATSTSIATIFGTCGAIMGMLGSILGIVTAVFTLQNLQGLIDLLSRLQGHELLNTAFFGEVLPNQANHETLVFVAISTVILSLVAGIIPAVKASLLKPSAVLRAEG